MSLRGGRSRNNSSASSTSKGRKQQPLLGEKELETFLADAEYEVHQDPYRGLQSQQQSLETGTRITTPWNACIWGTLQPEDVAADDLSSDAVVRHVGYCACPSMKAWTKLIQEANKKKKKGKKRARLSCPTYSDQIFAVGTRPSEKNYRCLCDYNPLCLGSLGGVVNDILIERSKETDMEGSEPMDVDEQENAKVEQNEKGIEEVTKNGNGASTKNRMQSQSVLERLPSPKGNEEHTRIKVEEPESNMTNAEESEKSTTELFAFLDETSKKKKSLARLKPLEHKQDIVQGHPAEVYTEDLSKNDLSDVTYSAATEARLKSVRHSIVSNANSIANYTRQTLRLGDKQFNGNGASSWTVAEYMEALKAWQASLALENPIAGESAALEGEIVISVPPGIENLGATCYLNTQLQCLAQNPAFLNGIFSWRAVNSTHNMNSVMSKMQLLFAQMVVGGDSKLSTLDFSNALGLQHNEQQDPNEFARLLFERMEESFQQCDEDGDLGNLLQRIFQGATTYETICMTCQHSSERSEGFMDLNLPIVKREVTNSKPANDIKAFFGKSVDTDVQYCLDQYLCTEILDGDNQYFCGECNCKRDARRVLKLTELPPVLNVQLSRYVFDLTQYVKKKLSDKVLLPTSLSVPKSDGSIKKYKLCAVMRHQGTSAYSGHYVAEAMDWLTGHWFEFNDENVKLLLDGPSCSYDPDPDGKEISDEKATVLSGSQDAYNMYYVDEDFLVQNSLDQLSRRAKHCARESNDTISETQEDSVLTEVAKKRQQKYAILSELCFADAKTADRLRRRRNGIRKSMLQNSGALVLESKDAKATHDDSVWVDASFLRRFLCLGRDLDTQIQSAGPVLRHKHLLCEHGRLHPEVSRRGKVLPRSMYDAYSSLLKGEQAFLRKEAKLSSDDGTEVNDYIITPSKNLFCDSCSRTYRNQLGTKMNRLRNMKDLFDYLDPSFDERGLQFKREDERILCPEDEFVYGVSKRMVTKYRNAIKEILQALAKRGEGGTTDPVNGYGKKSIWEGLDSLEVNLFECDSRSQSVEGMPSEKSYFKSFQLDKNFNAGITCHHDKCDVLHNGRLVRFVSWEVWKKVKKVFPESTSVKKKRIVEGETKPDDEGCPECRSEMMAYKQLVSDLATWSKETQEHFVLKDLIDGKRTVSRESEVKNFATAKGGCRLVHQLDIEAWRRAAKSLAKPQNIKAETCNELKAHVENIAFSSYHSVVLEFERQPVEKVVTSLRPLICRAHKLVIETAVFKGRGNADPVEGHFLADCIAVLSDDEYQAYISSLAELLPILYPDSKDREVGSIGSPVLVDTEKSLQRDIRRITDSYHPKIKHVDNGHRSDDILAFALGGSSKEFLLSPGVCHCETCNKEFAPLLIKSGPDIDERIESISVDSLDSNIAVQKKGPMIGSISTNPILVESDIEDGDTNQRNRFTLRVFQVKDTASIDEALKSLEEASALSPMEKEEGRMTSIVNNRKDSSDQLEKMSATIPFLRRSSRKRKSRYPFGCLLSESSINVGLHHNVAALRLLMYEKCEVSLSANKLTLVQSSNEKAHCTLDVKSEWNSRSLEELMDDMNKGHENGFKINPDPSGILLLFQQEDKGKMRPVNETVLDSLLQVANLESQNSERDGKVGKKRKRSSERGFQGTLLHSSGTSSNIQVGNSSIPETVRREKSDVSAISDEEKDTASASCERDDISRQKPQVVRNDGLSYDHHALPPPSPFAREVTREKKPIANCESKGKSYGISRTPDVGDDHAYVDLDDHNEKSCEIEENISDQLQEDLVAGLLKLLGEAADQSKCWDAAEWALKTNPQEKNKEKLLDKAVGKYFAS